MYINNDEHDINYYPLLKETKFVGDHNDACKYTDPGTEPNKMYRMNIPIDYFISSINGIGIKIDKG